MVNSAIKLIVTGRFRQNSPDCDVLFRFYVNKRIHRQLVVDNDVDGEVLAELSEDQLTELGISSFGHR